MEGLTAKVYNGVKCYWRTRRYHRLRTSVANRGHEEQQQQSQRRPRRSWRIRLTPRLKLKLPRSPRKMFLGLRDMYVKIMMKLASTSVVRGPSVAGYGVDGFGKTMVKEYDEKIIVEICKNLANREKHAQQISMQSQISCSS